MSENYLLEAVDIQKTFIMGSQKLQILKGISLNLRKGDDMCILGGSGAGKSTLLHILGGLERPSSGKVFFNSQAIHQKSEDQLAEIRNKNIGFVFQFHHLLQEFSAIENVAMPARIAGLGTRAAQRRAEKLLTDLGLGGRLRHFPSQLSGGEQQRVAIARALIMSPQILMADEPTGNLDSENANKIQDLFFQLKEEWGLTLLVVTHDQQFAKRFKYIKTIKDGLWS